MVQMPTPQNVLQEILTEAPGSMRELARAAGLSHVALIRARDGKMNLSQDAISGIACALREWGETCTGLADRLEASGEQQRAFGGEPGR